MKESCLKFEPEMRCTQTTDLAFLTSLVKAYKVFAPICHIEDTTGNSPGLSLNSLPVSFKALCLLHKPLEDVK